MTRFTYAISILVLVTTLACDSKPKDAEPVTRASETAKQTPAEASPSAPSGSPMEVEEHGIEFVCPSDAPELLCKQAATPRGGGYTLPVEVSFFGPMPAKDIEGTKQEFDKIMASIGSSVTERDGLLHLKRGESDVVGRPIMVGERTFVCQVTFTGKKTPERDSLEAFAKTMCDTAKPAKGHEERVSCDADKAACMKRCDGGDAWVCVDLAYMLKSDDATRASAEAPLKKACDAGNMQGCSELASSYKFGSFGEEKPAEAKPLYEKICAANVQSGCNSLAWTLDREGNLDGAIAIFEKSCSADHAKSCSDLSARFEKKGDAAKAKEAKARACKLGYTRACR